MSLTTTRRHDDKATCPGCHAGGWLAAPFRVLVGTTDDWETRKLYSVKLSTALEWRSDRAVGVLLPKGWTVWCGIENMNSNGHCFMPTGG